MGELDDLLGAQVAGGGLAREDLDARDVVLGRVGANVAVGRDDLQDVEQLALVFVDALDLDVEHRVGVDGEAELAADKGGERDLLEAALVAEFGAEARVLGVGDEVEERHGIGQYARADRVGEQVGEALVGRVEPAAEGDAVGLVDDAAGVDRVEIAEDRLLHQLGVKRRNAVDAVGADIGEMAHADAAAIGFVDQRYAGEEGVVAETGPLGAVEMGVVDHVDDLHVPGQQAFHQGNRPHLQGFGQERVVGVGEAFAGDAPGVVPGHAVYVDEKAHQLGDADRRVGVVELDGDLVGEVIHARIMAEMATEHVLQRG